jgi:hypothetical protein
MPAGAIGSVWETGTWEDTAWEADTWADAVLPVAGGLPQLLIIIIEEEEL